MSQTVTALLRLRELILSGELKPGQRLSELWVVDRLNVSRTPVRAALARLQEEGLLETLPYGGFAVKAFSEQEIHDAIELRGVLEGLAAQFAAERGPDRVRLGEMKACLAQVDEIIARPQLASDDFANYVEINERFHALLMEMADSPTLARQLARVAALPFASPSGFVMAHAAQPQARTILVTAQEQHRAVVNAIERGEGERAEAAMREHARLALRNLKTALDNHEALSSLPGGALIERRAAGEPVGG
jgi:GntR family transcriptional regulator, vanillate catabolism transcriptional regulator